MKRILSLSCAIMLLFAAVAVQATEPTAEETYFVELINKARANPGAEATRLGIELNEGIPLDKQIDDTAKAPVAIDATLTAVARAHSADMQANDFFSHYSQNGASPSDRCVAAGYNYFSGENIAYTAQWSTNPNNLIYPDQSQAQKHHDNLFIDKDYPDRGHRTNMMSDNHIAVGVGIVGGEDTTRPEYYGRNVYSSTDFGRPSGTIYICGVIYSDMNGNAFYDVGEGASGVQLSVSETGQSMTAWSSGAYAIALTSGGTYTVKAVYNGYEATKTVTVGSQNVKLDFTGPDFVGSSGTDGDSGTTTSNGDTGTTGDAGDTGTTDTGDSGTTTTGDTNTPTAGTGNVGLGVYAYDTSWNFKSQTVVETGDYFSFWVTITGSVSGYADMYLVMIVPDNGGTYFLDPSMAFASSATPVVSGFGLFTFDWLNLTSFYMPASAPKGTYTFAFIAAKAGENVYNNDNWIHIAVHTLTHQ